MSWQYVDLGANRGKTVSDWLKKRPQSQVLALEPCAELAAKLHARYKGDDRVDVRAQAAGTEDRVVNFYTGLKSDQSSTCVMGKTGKYGVDYQHPVRVPQADMDRVLTEWWEPGHRSVMKIDIEGAEYELVPYLIERGWAEKFEEIRIEWHAHKFGIDPAVHDRIKKDLESRTRVVPWK